MSPDGNLRQEVAVKRTAMSRMELRRVEVFQPGGEPGAAFGRCRGDALVELPADQAYGGSTRALRFGPTLAAEHLAEEDHLSIDAETLCAAGCGKQDYGAASAERNARIAGVVHARSILGNWCSSTAAFMLGSSSAAPEAV